MSNAVFPDIPGLKPDRPRVPAFKTLVQSAVSGAEARAGLRAYPLVTFTLGFEFLRHGVENDLRQIEGFFRARRGKYDSFLYADPADSSITDQSLGAGDGSTVAFQLQRTFGYGSDATFTEPVHNVLSITNVKVAGSTATYTVSATGLVTITSGTPSLGQAVTASFSYYHRCRFTHDEADFARFLDDLYTAKKIEFIGALQNKV